MRLQNNIQASYEESYQQLHFQSEDLPEMPLAPALGSPGGAVPRHITLSVVSQITTSSSANSKNFFPNHRSQSYQPGQSSGGISLVGQCTIAVNNTEVLLSPKP